MTTHSKLSPANADRIRYLYTIPGWSALEIAQELGLTFRQVCNFINSNLLGKMDIAVAKNVRKATRANNYPADDVGFYNPFWRQ